jgi:hypothetical protein
MIVLSAVVCTLNFVMGAHFMLSYLKRSSEVGLVIGLLNLMAGAFILAENLV